jgi:hypothetical protein
MGDRIELNPRTLCYIGESWPHMRTCRKWLATLAVALITASVPGPAQAAQAPRPELDEQNSWAFMPPADKFTPDALLDLRSLNENVAGEKGFVRLSPDGNDFLLGDGTPVRFWATGSDFDQAGGADKLDEHFRFLAKLGVNMVRFAAFPGVTEEGAKITDINDAAVDKAQRMVAAARKQGIYTFLTTYWALTVPPESWGIEGLPKGAAAWGLLFFDPKMQEGYKAWMRAILTRPNPYTGMPLSQDPAVAVIQAQNEDSLLFHTFSGLPEGPRQRLCTQYGGWLKEKYGSLAKALAAWQGTTHPKDDFAAGQAGMYAIWEFNSPYGDNPGPGKGRRMADQLNFLSWIEHKFYADMEAFFRDELGCRQLVNACNWRSGDPVLMEDLERWIYTANEVVALNRYTGVIHTGPNNGYRIDPGHYFQDVPVVTNPNTFPGAAKQPLGHPFILTEAAWVNPTRYTAEGPFLLAAYNSLTGLDASVWSGVTATTWMLDPRRSFWPVVPGEAGYAVHKWDSAFPEVYGMYPANALAFRKGYVAQAREPVVYEERAMEDMWARKVPIIAEEGKFDPNRDEGAFAPQSPVKQEVDRLAFLVGPVVVKFGGRSANNRVIDLSPYIDKSACIVRSVTGEIALDYKVGVCTLNAPRYQGAAGFLKAGGGRFDLADVSIATGNEYAAVSVVSLDGAPLAQSRRVLVQIGTVARLTGFVVQPETFKAGDRGIDGYKIVATGKPPWRIANTEVTLTISNPNLSKAVLLDEAGYAARDVAASRGGAALTVKLPPDTMYLILQ